MYWMHSINRALGLLALAAILAMLLVACGSEAEPTAPAAGGQPAATPTVEAMMEEAILTPEPTTVVLRDCRNGMRLRPGEGCRYTGGGSPQANVVLSVQHDGAICREGGPVKQEIGGGTINVDSLRLCSSGGFEGDAAFQSEIVASSNDDGSWTFYEPASRGDSPCSAGLVMREGDYCTVAILGVNVGTDRFEIRDGSGCYGNLCGGADLGLNDFIASKNSDGSWTIERVPGTTLQATPIPEPTVAPTATPRPTATPIPVPTATPIPEPAPVVLGDCQDDMQLQPGEGCRYTGGGSPRANVVLSVQHDGAICREGGPAKQEIGSITLNVDSLRLCSSGGFERDDAFQSEIVATANADGSWTFYESALSVTRASATPTPRPTARPEPTATPTPDSQGDGRCSAGIVMREGDYCTVSIPGMNVGTDRFEIRDGRGCYGNVCGGTGVRLNDFIASKNSNGSWTVERVPGTTPTAHPSSTATLPDPTKEPIIFSDLPWESAQLQNRIAQYIIEHGYDYPTGAISVATRPLFEGLQRGDTDVTMEIWLPSQDEAWDKARSDGSVLSVGRSLGSDWQSAFVIPEYLQQEYPDLDSVDDLKVPQFKELFQTPGSGDKARLVSCVINWACEIFNAAQVEGYGLSDHVHIVNPVSEAALNADLYGAYERQEPWLGYQWGTNDLALKLDLVRLEEPAYSDACWSTNRACAYEDSTIIIAVNSDLPRIAPDVVNMLRRWDFSVNVYKNAVRWQDANGVTDPDSTALWWLKSNPEIWSKWVTAEAAANVQAALDRGETAAGWPD